MTAIFHDPTFWVAVALLFFIAAVFKPVAKAVPKALDDRAAKIRREIEEAESIRAEAQELLAQYQRKQRESKADAERIVQHAREEAARLAAEGTARIEAGLKRREAAAMGRIRRAEAQAKAQVRARTVDLAVEAAARMLADRVAGPKGDALIDQAIRELPTGLRHGARIH